MDGDKSKDETRYEEHVKNEEARKGQRAHFRPAAQQAFEGTSNHRNIAQDVRAHGGRKIGLLIPRQQVAREGHPQHQGK